MHSSSSLSRYLRVCALLCYLSSVRQSELVQSFRAQISTTPAGQSLCRLPIPRAVDPPQAFCEQITHVVSALSSRKMALACSSDRIVARAGQRVTLRQQRRVFAKTSPRATKFSARTALTGTSTRYMKVAAEYLPLSVQTLCRTCNSLTGN